LVEGYNLNVSVDLAIAEADLTKVATEPQLSTQLVVVRRTPVGFLRIRSGPNTASSEVGRVVPGDTLTLLEEVSGWSKIRTVDGKEGYVSSVYVEKKQ
jgi:uncharacterized protein YgiM (DUF1202 family)